jgi:hypothetical protein
VSYSARILVCKGMALRATTLTADSRSLANLYCALLPAPEIVRNRNFRPNSRCHLCGARAIFTIFMHNAEIIKG